MHKMEILKLDLFAQSGGFGGYLMATIYSQGTIEHALGVILLILGVVNGLFMLWRNLKPKKKD